MFSDVRGILSELAVEGANGRIGRRDGVRDHVHHRGEVDVDAGGVKLETPGLSLSAKGAHGCGAPRASLMYRGTGRGSATGLPWCEAGQAPAR